MLCNSANFVLKLKIKVRNFKIRQRRQKKLHFLKTCQHRIFGKPFTYSTSTLQIIKKYPSREAIPLKPFNFLSYFSASFLLFTFHVFPSQRFIS